MQRSGNPSHLDTASSVLGVPPEALGPILARIPVPNHTYVSILIGALQRLAVLPWLNEARTAGLWPSNLDELPGQGGAAAELRGLTQSYPVLSAILDDNVAAPLDLEALRAILVILAWQLNGRMPTVQAELARACRVMAQDHRGSAALRVTYAPLAGALTMQDLAREAGNLSFPGDRPELARTWQAHVVPLLDGLSGSSSSTAGTSPPSQVPKRDARQTSGDAQADVSDPDRESAIHLWRPAKPANVPPDLEAEAGADFAQETWTYQVPVSASATPSAQRIALYQARQVIWNQDFLLIPEHASSLNWQEAGALGAYLRRMVGEQEFAVENAILALTLATGRTPPNLRAGSMGGVRVDRDADANAAAWDIDVPGGVYHQKVLRPPKAWEPEAEQAQLLEEVGDEVLLPLHSVVIDLIHRAGAALYSELGSDERTQEHLMRACRMASEALGITVLPGRARRSLSRLLQDQGRDLVATMLITSDTSGQSEAPLYYTVLQSGEVAKVYASAMEQIFGPTERSGALPRHRIGSRLLPTLPARREIVSAFDAGEAADDPVRGHNTLVNHLGGMLLDATGHRPTDALLHLRRRDFDVAGNQAIFSDKNIDVAHFPRLAAMPRMVGRQIDAYMVHLDELVGQLTGEARLQTLGALAGERPLLFHLQSLGSVHPLSFSAWREMLPDTCRRLPLNYGRTLIASRGRDLGASPEQLMIQLGHYEAVGFPFSGSGPTVPVLFSKSLSPVLDQLASSGGWRIRYGLGDAYRAPNPWRHLGPLRNWDDELKTYERQLEEARRQRAGALRTRAREARAVTAPWVDAVVQANAPNLAAALRGEGRGLQLEVLSAYDVADLQSKLSEKAGDDELVTLVALSTLRSRLNRARTKLGWSGFVPYRTRIFRRKHSNPFFPGMLSAREQLELLRAHVTKVPRLPPKNIGADSWRFARTGLALFLFGFVDTAEAMLSMLERRQELARPAMLRDIVLVPWSEDPDQVDALEGVAAVALANTRWRLKSAPIDRMTIEQALRLMLPAEAVPDDAVDVIDVLASTVSVANRLELSGIARSVRDPEHGAVSARLDSQLAWIDGDSGPTRNEPDIPAAAGTRPQGMESSQRPGEQERGLEHELQPEGPPVPTLRKQYEQLLGIFPHETRETHLPLTGVTISPLGREHARTKVGDEFEARSIDPSTHETIRGLAFWATQMLRHGTAQVEVPAYSTVYSYVTMIGSELVDLLGTTTLSSLDELEVSVALTAVAEIKATPKARSIAAREAANFYRSVSGFLTLPDIELDELSRYFDAPSRSSDASLITRSQVNHAIHVLAMPESGQGEAVSMAEGRAKRQARLLVELLGATGARSSEVLAAKLLDLRIDSNGFRFRVSRNRNRRLKTRAALRRYFLNHRIAPASQEALADILAGEADRLPIWQRERAYLFTAATDVRDITVRSQVRAQAVEALAQATGRGTERLHRMRHLVAMEFLLWLFSHGRRPERRPDCLPLSEAELPEDVLMPRDLVRQVLLLGHVDPLTTATVYCHFSWCPALPSLRWIASRLNRGTAAFAMGVTPAAVDKVVQRADGCDFADAMLNHVLMQRVPVCAGAEAPDVGLVDLAESIEQLGIEELRHILEWGERGADLRLGGVAMGSTRELAEKIHEAALLYERRTGVLFGAQSDSKGKPVTRRHSASKHIWGLLEVGADFDTQRSRRVVLIAEAAFSSAQVCHRGRVMLPRPEAESLLELLLQLGHPKSGLQLRDVQGTPLVELRVRRTESKGSLAGRELKRALGVVWIWSRIKGLNALRAQ